jgi:hypothetical protein
MQPKERIGRCSESAGAPAIEPGASPGGEKAPANSGRGPLLMVDIDGVISLFGRALDPNSGACAREGSFHSIEGIPHFLSSIAAAHLLELASVYELVWASGWEERAGEHLPHLLGLPAGLPFLRFQRGASGAPPREPPGGRRTLAHWKLDAIDAYAGERPLAWIDDALDHACHEWALARTAPTLLVQTEPELGLTEREARRLQAWALEQREG